MECTLPNLKVVVQLRLVPLAATLHSCPEVVVHLCAYTSGPSYHTPLPHVFNSRHMCVFPTKLQFSRQDLRRKDSTTKTFVAVKT